MFVRSIGLLLCISVMICANTYYIDYSGGSDANPGTSKSAPWKRCPGMVGFAASYSHTPGDVYLFKGGITWPSAVLPLTIANSGTVGSPDRYTTDHSWYVGTTWAQPTLDGQLFQKTLLYASEKSHILINDLRLINAGMAAANGIIAFKFSNCSYIEISNNTLAPQSWGCLYVITERTGNFNDIFIHHNDISACAFGMRFVPGAAASVMHNVQVYNNKIHDFKSQLSGSVHGDGIQCYNTPDVAASYDRYVDGFKIFNNRFYGDFSQVAGSGGAMTALIYLSGATQGVEIFNNLFAPQFSGSQSPNFFESFISLRDNPNRGGHHKIYNNTFVTPMAGGQAAAILEDDTRYPSPALDIKNNIFSNFNWPFDLRSTNHTIDYNNNYFVRDVGKWAGNFVGSFANWQALGLDVHGMSANPGFVSSTDQHLGTASPCIGKGANLSAIITTDIDGNARPGSSGFSIGAYEYGTSPLPSPLPPPPPSPLPLPPPPPPPPSQAPLPSTLVLWWPGNGSTGIVVDPSLTWSEETGALSYGLQVSTVSTFASTVVNRVGLTATTHEASGLSNNTTYFWRVNATKSSGTTVWSSPATFTTIASALPSPTLTLWWPTNGTTGIVIDPSLIWSEEAGALSYGLQVSTVATFASTVVNQVGLIATTFETSGLSNNITYFWRVNATKPNGTTDWSPPATFTTVAALPSPTLILWWPANEATGVVIDPSLTWSADSGALSYALQVSTDPGFSSPILTQTGIAATSFEATGLSYATTYYWRVNVTKASGVSGWSSASTFTTGKAPSNAFLQDAGTNGIVSIEAEHFAANIARNGSTWSTVSTAGYSGGGAMQALPNSGANINTGYAATSPRMDYLVNFVKPGKQYIWARGIGASGGDDSYHAGIDGKETPTCDRISSFTANWRWSRTDMDSRAAYFTVDTAGEHTVNIWMREDGLIIDKIVITTNPSYVPTGAGPAESRVGRLSKPIITGTVAQSESNSRGLDIRSGQNGIVQISLSSAGAYRLAVYTLSGQKVGTLIQSTGVAGLNAVLLRNIPQGLYVMKLSTAGGHISRKVAVGR